MSRVTVQIFLLYTSNLTVSRFFFSSILIKSMKNTIEQQMIYLFFKKMFE